MRETSLSARAIFGVGCALVASLGCGTTPREPRLLVAWEELGELDAEDDPSSSDRPETIDCNPLNGWYAEDDVIEVNTRVCNHASLGGPTRTAVRAGETVRGTLSHFDLTADEPSEAHVALWLDGELLFERRIAIPGPADVLDFEVVSERDVEAGAPFVLHLHNHGQNSWNLDPLFVE